MQTGFDIFGSAYGVMLRNDLHAPGSVDMLFLQRMCLLEEASVDVLYTAPPAISPEIVNHELYPFAQQFVGENDRQTLQNLLSFTQMTAKNCSTDFAEMEFGGTEKEILQRGTDWCADISRLGAVLCQCVGIPARMLHLVNRSRAYHGHMAVEVFYEGSYGVADFLYGWLFYDGRPLSAWELKNHHDAIRQQIDRSLWNYYPELYDGVAINGYDPMNPENRYPVSRPNDYYRQMMLRNKNDGCWVLGEDQQPQGGEQYGKTAQDAGEN